MAAAEEIWWLDVVAVMRSREGGGEGVGPSTNRSSAAQWRPGCRRSCGLTGVLLVAARGWRAGFRVPRPPRAWLKAGGPGAERARRRPPVGGRPTGEVLAMASSREEEPGSPSTES